MNADPTEAQLDDLAEALFEASQVQKIPCTPHGRAHVREVVAEWAQRHGQTTPPVFFFKQETWVGPMTAEVFERATGRPPERDDLDRVNCDRAWWHGHLMCGWSDERGLPRFMVGPS